MSDVSHRGGTLGQIGLLWDRLGNMAQRQDLAIGRATTELFEYDALQR